MRVLSPLLEDISTGQASRRAPAFRVEVFDLRSSISNTISDVVLGNTLEAVVGPEDFTELITQLDIKEVAGDYAVGSISSSVASLTLEDPDGRLDPLLLLEDTSSLARYFRNGNVVRVYEGDEAEDPSLWPNTFTLVLQGQPGYNRSRASQDSALVARAVSREATFLGFTRISREYIEGESYRNIGEDIARNEMGLDVDEINFSGWGTRLLRQATMTLAEESPIVMLARVMFADGFLPRFQGDGRLSQTLINTQGTVNRFYNNKNLQVDIAQPLNDIRPVDSVCVTGLDFNLSRVDQPRQVVATTSLTTGYFTQNEEVEILFSEDRSVLAENPTLIIKRSVNGGLTSLGGGEFITPIPAPNVMQEGFVGVTLNISTGYAPWLSVFLLVTYAVLAAVPDIVIVVGFIASSGTTINVGGIAQAIALSAALIIMTALGRGQYEIEAEPFEYVFAEIRQCARVAGTSEFSKNEISVVNHLVDDAVTAEDRAREILFQQQASKHVRRVNMLHDLALEPNDIFVTLDDERRFLTRSITRTLRRDTDAVLVALEVFELTDGIEVTA